MTISGNEDPELTTRLVRSIAQDLEFNLCGIAPAVSPPGYHRLVEWINAGHAADMEWIPRRLSAYQSPDGIQPGTKSVISLAMNYHDDNSQADENQLRVARYAQGSADYHDVLRSRLRKLTTQLSLRCPESRNRIVVDTAPLLEREFAQLAGLGWFGKNTMLINRRIGSWFVLGFVLTTLELQYDRPSEHNFCGSCTRCLDACPTNAFPEPGVLDARKCISYWTIEARTQPVPENLSAQFGGWVFGCDVCQEVCPWNRFAPLQAIPELQSRSATTELGVLDWLSMTDSEFQARFHGTPLERTGRTTMVRNVILAAGNLGLKETIPALIALRSDPSEQIQDAVEQSLPHLQM